jgi:hypothetical protein
MIYCLTIPSANIYVPLLPLADIIIIVSMLQTEIEFFFACTLHSRKLV